MLYEHLARKSPMPAKDLNKTDWIVSQDGREILPRPPELPTLEIPDHLKDAAFLSKKAGSFSSVPQRTVQLWSEKGFLIPEGRDTTGTGKRRLYSVVNCIEIGVLKSLARKRLGDKAIRDTMQFIRIPRWRENMLSGMAAYLHLYIDYDNPNEMVRTFSLYATPEVPPDKPSVGLHRVGLHAEYANKCDEVVTINIGKIVRKVLAEIT
jgi:hypothetical protein